MFLRKIISKILVYGVVFIGFMILLGNSSIIRTHIDRKTFFERIHRDCQKTEQVRATPLKKVKFL